MGPWWLRTALGEVNGNCWVFGTSGEKATIYRLPKYRFKSLTSWNQDRGQLWSFLIVCLSTVFSTTYTEKNLFSSFHLPLLQHVFFIRAASRIINIQNWFTEHGVRASSNSIVTRYSVTSALMITEMSVVADEMSTVLSTHVTFKLHASAK